MRFLHNWQGYGYCTKCNTHARKPCKRFFGFLPCKGRESIDRFNERWSLILSEHYGYTILPEEVHKYENGEMNDGYDTA